MRNDVRGPMKAATVSRYGSRGVIEVRDVPAPVPGSHEVLVRVHAATVNRTDCGELLFPALTRLLNGAWRSRRTILGMDFAGIVEAVGTAASMFKLGDRVFGMCPSRNAAPDRIRCHRRWRDCTDRFPLSSASESKLTNYRILSVIACWEQLPLLIHILRSTRTQA